MELQIRTILLVDDDPDYVFLIGRAFKEVRSDFQLRVAGDGVEAKDYIEGTGRYGDRQRYPFPELIVVDVRMPGWNGFEFLDWLRSKAPEEQRHLPVMLMSNSYREDDSHRAHSLGANSYTAKPADWKEIQECVQTWVRDLTDPHEAHTF